jgi:hypothetical protein
MHKKNYIIPIPAIALKQALTDIIESIAIGNKALSRILDAESRLLERVKNQAHSYDTLDDMNSSVNSIIKSITVIQLINKYELEEAEDTLKDSVCDNDEMEE